MAGAHRPECCAIRLVAASDTFVCSRSGEGPAALGDTERARHLRVESSKPHGHALYPGGSPRAISLSGGRGNVERIFRGAFSPRTACEAAMVREQLAVLDSGIVLQRLSFAPDRNRRQWIAAVSRRLSQRRMVRSLLPRRRANRSRRDPLVSTRHRPHRVPVARADRTRQAAWSRENPPPRPALPKAGSSRHRFRTAVAP